MKYPNLLESKLWNSITAVASGIMTNLICDLLSNNYYIIEADNDKYIVSQSNAQSMPSTILITLIVFFTIWGSFTAIIHIGTKAIRQLTFKKINCFSGKDFVNVINNTKEQIIKLQNKYGDDSNKISDNRYAKLKIRELTAIIIPLHAKVIYVAKHSSHLKDYFRRPDCYSIVNINDRVSIYELIALIDILYDIINKTSKHTDGNALMASDCKQIEELLGQTKDAVNNLEWK